MKAVIMAGGMGTRLRPLTCSMPKPMVPVFDKPVMEYSVNLLKKHGLTDIAVTLQFMPEIIKNYFGDGSRFGVKMYYFEETSPLGTAGSVKNAEDFLDGTFLVISGDGITDYDLSKAVEYHRQKGGMVTIVMAKVENPLEYGIIMCNNDGRIIRFLEKPSWAEVFSDTVNTGIYIIEPEVFKYYNKGVFFDFSKDLFPLLMKNEVPIYGYTASGYWSDIGSPEQYCKTHFDVLDGLLKVDINSRQAEPGIWLGQGTRLESRVKIKNKPVYIGANCKIEPGTELGKYTVIGNDNYISSGSYIEKSILWDETRIGHSSDIRGAVLCSRVKVGADSTIRDGAIIGEGSILGDKVTIRPHVKIWPDKVIEDNSVVSSSVILPQSHPKNLFNDYGISGIANKTVTPEMAAKIGAALGTIIPCGKNIVVSTDHHRCTHLFKNALIAGICSTGTGVLDIGVATTPIARYAVRSLQASSAVHIRMLREKILFEFLDQDGVNISKDTERKLENMYIQEEFRRVNAEDFGYSQYIPQLAEAYMEALFNTIDRDAVKRNRCSLLVAYDHENLDWFVPPLLEKLSCSVTVVDARDYTMEDISIIVQENPIDLGVHLNSNADEVVLFTPGGDIIKDERLLTLWAYITMNKVKDEQISIPVTAPSVIEKLAVRMGGRVYRTKSNMRDIMEAYKERPFQPLFDGVYLFLQILEYIQVRNTDIDSVMEELPRTYILRKEVTCSFNEKGMVMRQLIEETGSEKVELFDGIKIYTQDGWALIRPDAEEPVFKVFSEASSLEAARNLVNIYVSKIKQLKS